MSNDQWLTFGWFQLQIYLLLAIAPNCTKTSRRTSSDISFLNINPTFKLIAAEIKKLIHCGDLTQLVF